VLRTSLGAIPKPPLAWRRLLLPHRRDPAIRRAWPPRIIGDAIRRSFARFWPILGVSILVSLGIFVGLILFIIPGIMLAPRWAVALPACVVDNIGPLAAMRRSAELTRSHRWKILIFTFAFIGVFALYVEAAPEGLGQFILAGINVIVSGIVTAYFKIVAAMIYHDLRTLKKAWARRRSPRCSIDATMQAIPATIAPSKG
jgi:Membrane domain of glycerophosphoryl diester phosphodiesterase